MMKREFRSVDEYIASQPEAVADILEQVRRTIQETLPTAEEVISYKMPAFKLDGEVALYLAGWKKHYSLYPVGPLLMEVMKDQLAPYIVHKGTIRFSYADPVAIKLIEQIARYRALEVAERRIRRRAK
jgi:uncharacterized protein YdhG (YjbR/CyaY superfamily)